MNGRPPVQQWQQPWQPNAMPPSNNRPSQTRVQQQESEHQQMRSRGRSRHQQDTTATTSNPSARDDSKSHSNSNTPRRKGNPQSPQCAQQQHMQSTHVDSLEVHKSRSRSHSSSRIANPGGNVDLTTPLATLSTILTTTKSYHECAIKSYRVNHKLFRDAKDRTAKAQQALAQAQAEYEHATTAQEYAHSELTASLTTKQQCETHTIEIEKQVRKLGKQLKGKRVKLVGLTQNVKWNQRTGVIIKLVIEGDDCGRWKVRLDKERRGGDPEGMDGRDSLNGEASGDVTGNRENSQKQAASQDFVEENDENNILSHHVVAKSENLELLDDVDPIGFVGTATAASIVSSRSRSRSNKSVTSFRRETASGVSSAKGRDPSTSRYGKDFGGRQRQPYAHDIGDTPAVVSPINGDYLHHTSPSHQRIQSSLSPSQMMTPKKNRKNLSSAFSNMLLSPVSFENVSFTARPTNSLASPTKSVERYENPHVNKSDNSLAGSFFDEVTSQEQSFPRVDKANQFEFHERDTVHIQEQHEEAYTHSVEGESHCGYPQEVYSTDLPHLVILPVQEDEENDYASPHCIGVQGAGVPHVNGVYLLANDQHTSSRSSSPLYFKDSPPTLLEDDRYYDMCILRIDCPDSPKHVIWFLSRVDVDPTCLDVKFSDCYYYCRMQRNNYNGTNNCPPLHGWNIPKVPPGIAIAPSTSFSLESEGYHANELDEHGRYA